MRKFKYVVTDPKGIHARPAGLVVKQASGYKSDIIIKKGGRTADAKRIFSVMGLGIKCGEEISFVIDGEDEEVSAKQLEAFIKENL